MTLYAALIYSVDVDWSEPQYADVTAEYGAFGQAAAAVIRGGAGRRERLAWDFEMSR